MFREIKLEPIVPHDGPLDFAWDSDTGTFSGRDADRVQALVDEANARGMVTGHPYPTVYDITDPARTPSELAVVLGRYWTLTGELAAAYPAIAADDAPEGALH
ncbi:MAG: hypothetical protein Q8L65_15050 [Burkholderiales bacterium]|nr:hypothetical protein [Burkholderiales bacterium]